MSKPLTYWGTMLYAVLCLTAMAPMSIGAALLIVGLLADRGGPRAFGKELLEVTRTREGRRYAITSLALVAACVASIAGARWHPLTFGGYEPQTVAWLSDLAKMWYFALPLALAVGWRRLATEQQACVLKAWIICFGLLSAVGVAQFFTGSPRAQPNPLLPGYFHPVLFLGHHLSVANIWIFPFFAGLELLTNRPLRERLRLGMGFVGPAMACGLFTLLFAYSRTLWFALPVGLVLWSLLRLPLKTALVAVAGLVVLGGAFMLTPMIQERLHTSMGVGDRIELWKANWVFFKERPLFGVGLGKNQGLSYDYFRSLHPGQTDFFIGHAHNVYLELLAGIGILGTLAWVAWVGRAMGSLAGRLREPLPLGFAGAMLSAWVVFLINGATQVNFWESKVMHQVMWVVGLGIGWSLPSNLLERPA